MVIGQDGFDWVTPEEYYTDREDKEYQLITNAELLDYRAKGLGGLAFNTQAIYTVANGMGSKQITELINAAVTSLGKMKSNEELTGYVGVTAGDLMQGLKDYTKALKNDVKGLKIGVPKEYFGEGINEEVSTSVKNAIKNNHISHLNDIN